MKATIEKILKSHNIYNDCIEAINNKTPWEVEILPTGTQFSRPLSIITNGHTIQISHYTISEYDVDYNPLIEFKINEKGWNPVSIYRFYEGLRVVGKSIEMEEIADEVEKWSVELERNGYADLSQGMVNQKYTNAKL